MPTHQYHFEYELLENDTQLPETDRQLLEKARLATQHAYAPYSHFNVSAVARLTNGTFVTGTNQENASYPVGICAERTLLGILASLYPGQAIDTMAITYHNLNGGANDKPASPCGLCRQSLLEYQQRIGQPIRLVLAGITGPIMIVSNAANLLPFGFGPDDLKG